MPRQGHNTPCPLKRSPPASFKRLLGSCATGTELGDEFRTGHYTRGELRGQLFSTTTVNKAGRVTRHEDVPTLPNVAAEDHGVTQLAAVPCCKIGAFGRWWKRPAAYHGERTLQALAVRLTTPHCLVPLAFIPNRGLRHVSEGRGEGREARTTDFTIGDRNHSEIEAPGLKCSPEVVGRQGVGVESNRWHSAKSTTDGTQLPN